jgi:DNA-binding transcriptional LysR family regulator
VELRHLRYFLAVAEEGHVTRAAERIGIQQPPLSQQIRALEEELGVQLFRRRPRGVELTEAGRAFLSGTLGVLRQIEDAVATARRTARGEQGQISIGFTSSAPFHPFVPQLIGAFRQARPLVSVAMEEGGTVDLIEALRSERIDAALVRTRVADMEGLAVTSLLEEPMVVALPAGHPSTQRKRANGKPAPVGLAELSSDAFVVYRRRTGPGLYDAVIAACRAAGFSPQIGQEAPRIGSTLAFVASGLGISFVPASMQRMKIEGVVYRQLRGAPVKAPLILATRRGTASASLQHFVEMARRKAREDLSD